MSVYEYAPPYWDNIHNIELVEVEAICAEPSEIQQIIRDVPCQSIKHGKRIHKIDGKLHVLVGDITHSYTTTKVKVPRYPPRTPTEAKILARLHWPVTFRKGFFGWEPAPLESPLRVGLLPFDLRYPNHPLPQVECAYKCRVYINGAMAADKSTDPANPVAHACMEAISHVSSKIKSRRKRGGCDDRMCDAVRLDEDQYYCTGADVVVSGEPCYMCSMAFVHSRISRLFVAVDKIPESKEDTYYNILKETGTVSNLERQSSHGGIFQGGITFEKSLNHHFRVYIYTMSPE